MVFNKFKVGNSYIIGKIQNSQDAYHFPGSMKKIKVLEITRLSILIQELDYGPPHPVSRLLLELFNQNWKIVEILGDLPAQTFPGHGPTNVVLNS